MLIFLSVTQYCSNFARLTRKVIFYVMRKFFVLAFCIMFLFSCADIGRKQEKKPVEVEVLVIDSLGNVDGTHYVGNVSPCREARLTSRHSGRIAEVLVRQGARVSAGQPLLKIDSQQISAANDAAEATLRQAEDGLRRVQQVHQSGSVADVKLVEIETKVAQARATVAASRKSLDECTIRAPFAGIVAELSAEMGVETGVVEELVRVVDMSSVDIVMAVSEREINNVRIGDRACVEIPSLDARIQATVTEKNIVGNELSHSYKCRLRLQQIPEGVMPGMICRVFMIDDSVQHRIVIPADIIRMDEEGKYIWIINSDGVTEKRRITLGNFVGKGVEVVSGLSFGDRVVTKGTLKISTGTRVVIK